MWLSMDEDGIVENDETVPDAEPVELFYGPPREEDCPF